MNIRTLILPIGAVVALIAGCSGGQAASPAPAISPQPLVSPAAPNATSYTPHSPMGLRAYVLPVLPEVEAQLNAAPDDAARLDILARAACVYDAQMLQADAAGQPYSDESLGRSNGLSDRYTLIQGNLQRQPDGQITWVAVNRVPGAGEILVDQEAKFCPSTVK